jgi:hypothetical protein
MAKKVLKEETAAALAARLAGIRFELLPLEEAYEKTKKALFEAMKREGKKAGDREDMFLIARRDSIVVKDKVKAAAWAMKHGVWKVDTTAMRKIVADPRVSFPFDDGFDLESTEYLTVREEKDEAF